MNYAIELFDRIGAAALIFLLAPVFICLFVAIRLESRGPALFRCRRVGLHGREFLMLKFRKMHVSAAGGALTSPSDERFTRLGRFMAASKLDELPQLFNVLGGAMSLVGPRPEDPQFVELAPEDFHEICQVKPGISGLTQLAFARESEILDPENRLGDYVQRLLPQKILLDKLYASRRSLRLNLQILFWTAATVILRRSVAVHRESGRLRTRRRPAPGTAAEMGLPG